jgi:D-arabinose 1-dehydrogenase-like Zn-dependent alcohol dehydrogenase
MPEGLSFAEAAPLLCAGVTTFNALRHSPAMQGDLVAVQGVGGLGHLGVQFARAMGFRVTAITGGSDKVDLAEQLGAHVVIDAKPGDVAAELQRLGGASVSALVAGLSRNGTLLVVAAPHEPLSINALDLIAARRRIQGWPSGTAEDSSATMAFAARHGIRPTVETFPLARANEAYRHMIEGKARFRAVLET